MPFEALERIFPARFLEHSQDEFSSRVRPLRFRFNGLTAYRRYRPLLLAEGVIRELALVLNFVLFCE
jgi:hypothetical protein